MELTNIEMKLYFKYTEDLSDLSQNIKDLQTFLDSTTNSVTRSYIKVTKEQNYHIDNGFECAMKRIALERGISKLKKTYAVKYSFCKYVEEFLSILSPDDKSMLEHRYKERMSFEDIAALYNTNKKDIQNTINNILKHQYF